MKRLLAAAMLALLPVCGQAEDRVDLEGTSIIGNRELPKVLYIAPWKKAQMSELGRPVNTLINENLAPLEREVFVRTMRYHEDLQVSPAAADKP